MGVRKQSLVELGVEGVHDLGTLDGTPPPFHWTHDFGLRQTQETTAPTDPAATLYNATYWGSIPGGPL